MASTSTHYLDKTIRIVIRYHVTILLFTFVFVTSIDSKNVENVSTIMAEINFLQDPNSTINTKAVSLVRRRLRPSMKLNFHGYHDMKNIPSAWTAWLNEWKQKKRDRKKIPINTNDGRLPYWLGHGTEGVDPPPWAIMPASDAYKTDYSKVYYGRPRFCFLSTSRGNCSWEVTRWAFIPHKGTCDQFIYSGCGENANNFVSEKHCKERCGHPPTESCCGGFFENTTKNTL